MFFPRRMFPVLRVKLFNLIPDAHYNVWMDVVNTDGQQYKRQVRFRCSSVNLSQ